MARESLLEKGEKPSRAAIIAAFATVYLVWGSTYLGMRVAVETLPPFTLASVRFFVAGLILTAWSLRRWQTLPAVTRVHWREAAISGGLLLVGGNGAVVWAVQYAPSGLVALMVATVPLWMVALDWTLQGHRPNALVAVGLVAGLGGVALLLGPAALGHTAAAATTSATRTSIPPLAALAMILGAVSWSAGSWRARRAPGLKDAPLLMTGLQMLLGGAGLGLVAVATSEPQSVHAAAVSLRSVLAVAYLVIFGSLIAYSAFIWLLPRVSPARASTYAYVNPVIAVLLGWGIGHEPLTARILLAAAIILGAVALITWGSAINPARAGASSRARG